MLERTPRDSSDVDSNSGGYWANFSPLSNEKCVHNSGQYRRGNITDFPIKYAQP